MGMKPRRRPTVGRIKEELVRASVAHAFRENVGTDTWGDGYDCGYDLGITSVLEWFLEGGEGPALRCEHGIREKTIAALMLKKKDL